MIRLRTVTLQIHHRVDVPFVGSLSQCYSLHIAFISLTVHSSLQKGSTQFLLPSRCSQFRQVFVFFWFLHILAPDHFNMSPIILYWRVGSVDSRIPILPKLQCCCSTGAETGFIPTSAQIFAARRFLGTEISVLLSFFHPNISGINVCRSWSCSQPIRQRIRRRTVTWDFNFHLKSKSMKMDPKDGPT